MKYREVPIDQIVTGRNVREMPEEELGDLMDSIEQHGLLQPVIVRPKGKRFEIVVGHRRLAAMRARNEATIPAIINEEITERERTFIQLVENSQRKQMTPWEYVEVFNFLRKGDRSMSYAKIGKLIGRSSNWVSHQYEAVRLSGALVGDGESKNEVTSLTAGQIIGRAQLRGLTVKGPRRTRDISVQCVNSTTINVRCKDTGVVGRVLEALDAVRAEIRKEMGT